MRDERSAGEGPNAIRIRGERIAGWLLSWGMSHERAAAIVGDLVENVERRGARWFWITTLRIASACTWRHLLSPPVSEGAMTRGGGSFFSTLWQHRRLLLTCMLVVGAAISVAAYSYPARYRAEAVIKVMPGRVAADYVTAHAKQNLDDRIGSIGRLSRDRLARIVMEFNLYPSRRHLLMDEVINRVRRDISVVALPGDVIRVAFDADQPLVTQRVTQRLTGWLMEDMMLDDERQSTLAVRFLESRIEKVRGDLDAKEQEIAGHPRVSKAENIEYEVLQQEYRDLLTKRAQALTIERLVQVQIGEQFRLLEPPRLPTAPVTPNRLALSTGGALAGLGLGIAFVGISSRRRTGEPSAS